MILPDAGAISTCAAFWSKINILVFCQNLSNQILIPVVKEIECMIQNVLILIYRKDFKLESLLEKAEAKFGKTTVKDR